MRKENTTQDMQLIVALSFPTLAAISLCFIGYVSITFANQPPLDMYFFRQTQTALTAYWAVQEGIKLNYITPVGGSPWTLPFEFPIYQFLVALIVQAFGAPIDAVGRLLSFAFLLGCLFPFYQISRRLFIARETWLVFTALFLTAPLYVYWGRTFMIETAALYFTIAAMPYLIDLIRGNPPWQSVIACMAFLTLAFLQKATTAIPVVGIMGCIWLFVNFTDRTRLASTLSIQGILKALLCFAVPLLIGAAWVFYTDAVKSETAFGRQLTSAALSTWNWGTLTQRVSPSLFHDVIGFRMLVQNAAGPLGVLILIGAFATRTAKPVRRNVAICLLLAIVPLFVFTNLHIQHDYYQVASTVFLIGAVSIALTESTRAIFSRWGTSAVAITSLALTIAIMASNAYWFQTSYSPMVRVEFTTTNHRDMAVGSALRQNLERHSAFVAFGNDWNSSFSYVAQRKSFTAPPWSSEYEQIWMNPEKFVTPEKLGAVVACPLAPATALTDDTHTTQRVTDFIGRHPSWGRGEVMGCEILLDDNVTSQVRTNERQVTKLDQCDGSIDIIDARPVGPKNIVDKTMRIDGWNALSAAEGRLPSATYVIFTKANETHVFRAIGTTRADVAQAFSQPAAAQAGFNALIDVGALEGTYDLSIGRMNGETFEACPVVTSVTIEADGKRSE